MGHLKVVEIIFIFLLLTASQVFALSAPGIPNIKFVSPGNTYALVSFDGASSTGGSPITSYSVYSSDGQVTTGVNSPIMVTGLTLGATYTFYVRANNAVGSSAWSSPSPAMKTVTLVQAAPQEKIDITVDSSTYNYQIYQAAGRPLGRVDVTLTILRGVVIGSQQPMYPALTTGTGWAAGSTIKIINRGSIVGAGGNGGEGAWWVIGNNKRALPGSKGGDAISVQWPVTIDNSQGFIAGGGGGGGGGVGMSPALDPNQANYNGGRGGGGGAGSVPGKGGDCGHPLFTEPVSSVSHFNYPNVKCGSNATFSPSAASADQLVSSSPGGLPILVAQSFGSYGDGGFGGGLGQPGQNSRTDYCNTYNNSLSFNPIVICPAFIFGAGGRPGNSVIRNGVASTVTWLGGNTLTKVLGPQSIATSLGATGTVAIQTKHAVPTLCRVFIDECTSKEFPTRNAVLSVNGLSGSFDQLINNLSVQNDRNLCFALGEDFTKKNKCQTPITSAFFNSQGGLEGIQLSKNSRPKKIDAGVLMNIINLILDE